jgi:nucleoside-triphosphatase THEP1
LEYEPESLKRAKSRFKKIREKLEEMGRGFKDNIPHDEFLKQLQITEEEYLVAVRSSLRRATVFLRRSTNATFVNAYNTKLLRAWRANIDIQFILDPFACAKYCVSYISKTNGGMSKLMRKVCEEVKQGHLSLKEKLRKFVNVFMNSSEISAQEAAYWVLSLPLTTCSRDEIYINTGPPEERVFLLKTTAELEELDDDSENISVKGMLDHYSHRPEELEQVPLAEFAAMYNYSKSQKGSNSMPLKDASGFVNRRSRAKIVRYRRYCEAVDPLNFYREEVMLYVPWRNEDRELIVDDIAAKYRNNIDTIKENRKVLHNTDQSDAINEAFEEMADGEMEDLLPKSTFEVQEDAFDILEEITGKKTNTKVDYLVPLKQVPEDEYWQLIRALNEKQRKYFLHVVHLLKKAEKPFYDFVTGGAGVGKSHLITAIVQTILRLFASVPGVCLESVFVLVCASTGKAAFNVRGVTLHCAFRLPPNQYGGKLAKLPDGVCNSLRMKLQHLKLIVIDEISMMSLKHLYQINDRLKQIFGEEKLFGGIPFTVVGDFHQIRPVFARFVFQELNSDPIQALVGNVLWELFQMFELTEVMRQKGDLDFINALNSMAKGSMTDADIKLIKSREVSKTVIPPTDAIRLFWSNVECNEFNDSYQNSLSTEEAVSHAFDQVQGSGTEYEKDALLEYAKTFKTQEADGMPVEVRLKVGAIYMVSTNVDVADGLFNGATGLLKLIELGTTSEGERIPIMGYLDFGDPLIGSNMRAKHRGRMVARNINLAWTPIPFETKTLTKTGVNRNLQVVRTQLPLVSANGITITKSQGSTYKKVVVKLKKCLPRDQLYVACSRSTTLDGLFLDGAFEPPPPPPEYVLLELARLRKQGFKFSLQFMQDIPNTHYKLMFHNVQSLHKHHLDILCDQCYTSADMMSFVEPWILDNEEYDFEGFRAYQRVNCRYPRNSVGSIVYVKENIQGTLRNPSQTSAKSGPGHIDFTFWNLNTVQLVMIYRSPKSRVQDFLNHLDAVLVKLNAGNTPTVIFGDFNIDLNHKDGDQCRAICTKHKLRSRLPPRCSTTDGNTQIDGCFSNLKFIEAWTYESVFSYHKPICITWVKGSEELKKDEEPEDEGNGRTTPEDMETDAENVCTITPRMENLTFSAHQSEEDMLLSFADDTLDCIWKEYNHRQVTIVQIDKIRAEFQAVSEKLEYICNLLGIRNYAMPTNPRQDERSSSTLPKPFLLHYIPVYTSPDGNCFYNAVSISLFGDEKYYSLIKLAILYDISKNELGYRRFAEAHAIQYEEIFQTAMRRREYANETTMYAASKVLRRPILSYDMQFGICQNITDVDEFLTLMSNRRYVPHRFLLFDSQDEQRRPICIHHRNMQEGGEKNHFVALVPRELDSPIFPANQDYYHQFRRFGGDLPMY